MPSGRISSRLIVGCGGATTVVVAGVFWYMTVVLGGCCTYIVSVLVAFAIAEIANALENIVAGIHALQWCGGQWCGGGLCHPGRAVEICAAKAARAVISIIFNVFISILGWIQI